MGPEATAPESRELRERKGVRLHLFGALTFVTLVVLAWRLTPLSELDSLERITELVHALRAQRLAPLYVTGGLVVGTLLFLPSSLLIAGTVLALGPVQGGACALLGALISAALGYGMGRVLGRRPLDRFSTPRMRTLQQALCTRGFRTTLIARFLPLGNFTAINMIAGSLAVPFRAFMLGNVVGIIPGVLVWALFAHELARLFS